MDSFYQTDPVSKLEDFERMEITKQIKAARHRMAVKTRVIGRLGISSRLLRADYTDSDVN